MTARNKFKFYLVSSLMCLSTEYAFSKAQTYENTSTLTAINSNVVGMKAVNSKLSPHDTTMKDLLLTSQEKNAVLKNIDKVLKNKNKVIFEYMKLTKSLNSKINELSLSDKIRGEFKKRELSSNIDNQDDLVIDLKNKLVEKNLKINFLKKMVKNQNIQLTQKIHKLNFKIKRLSESFNKMPKEMEKMAFITESKHIQEIRSLQNQLYVKNIKIIGYQEQLMKFEDFTEIAKQNSQLAQELKGSNEELQKYQISYKKIQDKLTQEIQKNRQLAQQSQNIEMEYRGHIKMLQEKYSSVTGSEKSKRKGTRMPASVTESEILVNNIDVGYLVEIDPRHLKITLDERFFFNSGEARLSQISIQNIKSLISAYSKEIFSKDELKDRLESIQIIGHASPIYKGQFINPLEATKEAYQANMNISLNRAKSIVEIIIGENSNVPFKEEVRSKLVVSGKSFSEPMLLKRGPASSEKRDCGGFDCEASQRVEIIFELQKKE